MDNLRFRWLHTLWIRLGAAVYIVGAFWTPPVLAQSFPQKPLRMIIPFAAAGPPDILGRVISQKMAEGLGQPVIVENRVGAGGTIGSEAVAKAPPDGYTMLFASIASLGISPEAGLPGFTAVSWFGVVAPRATPNDIVKRLNAEIVKAIGMTDLSATLVKFGLEPAHSTPEQFAAIIKADVPKWAAAVKSSGAKVQ